MNYEPKGIYARLMIAKNANPASGAARWDDVVKNLEALRQKASGTKASEVDFMRAEVHMQRGEPDKPDPILVHLLSPGQTKVHATLTLRGRNREDFVGGKVYAHLYCRCSPEIA